MNTITKTLSLITALLIPTLTTEAGQVRGYVRSNGTYVPPHTRSTGGAVGGTTSSPYAYRNPYAVDPTVHVREYTRESGTVVLPHVRTPANETLTDNLNYRGFGTVRMPSANSQEVKPQPLPYITR